MGFSMASSPRLNCRRLLSGPPDFFARTHRTTTAASPATKPLVPSYKTKKPPPFPATPPSPPIMSGSSPWLMLPPSFDDDTRSVVYNFYSLADNIVLTLPQTEVLNHLMPNPIRSIIFCGSSHGWISLLNPRTLNLFIYNPISLHYIILPPIHTLPNYPGVDYTSVHKLILSSSPDEEEQTCRAVIMYNCVNALAVCCPGLSNEWTQIGIFPTKDANGKRMGNYYNDVVYSSRQNLFFALTDLSEIETWDFTDLSSPLLVKKINTGGNQNFDRPRPSLFNDLDVKPGPTEYLVVADELFSEGQDDVLLVTRYVIGEVAPDGSYIDYDYPPDYFPSRVMDPSVYPIMRIPHGLPPVMRVSDFFFYPHMTIGFYVDVYDQKEDVLRTGLSSLGDLALFIGSCSDSAALSVTRFPGLKSNSVYFTDEYMEIGESDESFCGHDIGIFDFERETVSPCYYPCDRPSLKKIAPSPIWFFPRLPAVAEF